LQARPNSFTALKTNDMKKIVFTFFMGLAVCGASGQQKQGRVVYQRVAQMQMRMQGMGDEMEHMIPRSRTDKLEVLFGNDQSLRRTLEDDTPDENTGGEGGMQIRMMVAGGNDITYMNFAAGRVVEQREFAATNYIIADSLHKLNWKLTGETSILLNYPCQKAVAQRIGKRNMATMENGQLKQQEVADTSNITVWFTPNIPVPAGPEYQGQLPGLILGIDINDGRTVYKAIEVSEKIDLSVIKEPTKGKKVTADEFAKERDKLMKDMMRNNGGRGRTIRVTN
jgi:GLPGLI family protein